MIRMVAACVLLLLTAELNAHNDKAVPHLEGMPKQGNQSFLGKSTPILLGEQRSVYSNHLAQTLSVNIYLPASYQSKPKQAYPVIYLLDGGLEQDFIHTAGIIQFGTFDWIKMLPESILVGIENQDRKRDFTPHSKDVRDQNDFPTQGGAPQFTQFITQDLLPLIEQKYRTQAPRTLIGQSLGGLFASHLLHSSPNVFDHYIIISPSLWWDEYALLKKDFNQPFDKVGSVYIAVGKEGEAMEKIAQELHKKVAAHMNAQSVHFKYFPKRSHGDVHHLAVYDAFETLFKAQN